MSDDADEIQTMLEEAEELLDNEQDVEALEIFQKAWEQLPEPKADHDLSLEILAAITDCHFFLENWEACRDTIQLAFQSGAEPSELYFRLRLGQALYELGEEAEASNWLVPVYLEEGRDPFEDEDPKYLEFFQSKLIPPEGGWPEGW